MQSPQTAAKTSHAPASQAAAVVAPLAEARVKIDARPATRPVPGAVPAAKAPQSAPLLRQNMVSGRVEITVVLLPGFALYDLAALCDTFDAANRQAERKVFTWRLVSLDGQPVQNALGGLVGVQGAVDPQTQPDNILLLSGGDFSGTERLQAWLRQAVSRHAHVLASGAAV
ncbi:MAG TPA: hypothetical protein VND94_07000, partial [Terriglobia bacterium]|nr:hypothetical protein [Terriglobia bacterium]